MSSGFDIVCAPRVRIYESCELSSSLAGDDIPQLLLYFRRPLPLNVNDSVDSIVLLLLLPFFVPREFKSHHAIFELISQPGFDASEFSLDVEAVVATGVGDGDRCRADDGGGGNVASVIDAMAEVAAPPFVLRRRLFVAAASRYALIFFVGVMTRRKPDFRRRRCLAVAAFADAFCKGVAFSITSSLAFGIRTSSMLFTFNRLLFAACSV